MCCGTKGNKARWESPVFPQDRSVLKIQPIKNDKSNGNSNNSKSSEKVNDRPDSYRLLAIVVAIDIEKIVCQLLKTNNPTRYHQGNQTKKEKDYG